MNKTALTVGRCTLVGAGPGDPELLTVKALRAIRRATVLLGDDLVSDELLRFALRGLKQRPRIVHVGKRGGCASTPQAFIEKLMVAECLKGEQLVRLKGGDPFVFGRGGEEVQALRAHGIAVDVVNGITSGLAAATSLGVPLTHRDHARGVIFVTGHARDGGKGPDWAALAQAAAQGLTLVIYMGVAQAPRVQSGLLAELPGATPVAVVQYASLPQQREVVTTLDDLDAAIEREGLGSPAIIIVGNVLRSLELQQAATLRFG
jgi:uroporphyrin-III C-methyltransferase